ncbi:MAG: class I SAM-dependent methyltransferase [Chitinophagaceae bacterium]|jgi:2-polyprenyl-3-methyl-5-hydroxy-6-metoxy-1,4-benzoquinol methylase|nr:class I SAM-dependent methyltransferase [Chitinophagaceae bacterium]
MSQLVHYTSCPVCKSQSFNQVLNVKDFTVSQELFPIVECNDCSLRFTQQIPDETAVQRYYQSANYISHTNTNKGIINRLYHIARTFTMMSKESLVKNATKKAVGMLLDVGSGTGTFVHTMSVAGWNVVGLEPDAAARAVALKKYNCDIYPSEELFMLPASTYDAVTMWHVLEHVHRLDEYIDQLKKIVAPGGKLIIAVPNYTSYDAEFYREDWASYDVPRHLYHFSPKSMRMLMERHGLKVIATKPMWLDSIYVSLLSERNKKGNFLSGIWNGLKSNFYALFHKEKCSSLVYIIELAPGA